MKKAIEFEHITIELPIVVRKTELWFVEKCLNLMFKRDPLLSLNVHNDYVLYRMGLDIDQEVKQRAAEISDYQSFLRARVRDDEIREDLLRKMIKLYQIINSGKTPILVFPGIDGSGKTQFFNQVQESCNRDNIPCIKISLNQEYESDPLKIFVDIERQLRSFQKSEETMEFDSRDRDLLEEIWTDIMKNHPNFLQDWQNRPKSSADNGFYTWNLPGQLGKKLKDFLDAYQKLESQGFVLIIDKETDYHNDSLDVFVNELVIPTVLLKNPGVLLVNTRKSFRDPELRKREVGEFYLPGLTKKAVMRICSYLNLTNYAELIFEITGGFPAAVSFLINKIKEQYPQGIPEGIDLAKELTNELGSYLRERYLKEFSQEEEQAIFALGLIGEIDAELIHQIFPGLNLRELLKELTKRRIIQSKGEKMIFNPELSRMIHFYQLFNFPEFYERIHRQAFEYYLNFVVIEDNISLLTDSIAKTIHHGFCLHSYESVINWLRNMLDYSYKVLKEDTFRRFLILLEEKIRSDKDLCELYLDDYYSLLGEFTYYWNQLIRKEKNVDSNDESSINFEI